MSLFEKKPEEDPEINLEDLDDLLAELSAAEIEELNGDFDPDNSLLPPSDRCKNQTSKSATGSFSRQKLLQFLEDKAKHEKDWEDSVPFSKESKGKRFIAKDEGKRVLSEADSAIETEWDEILKAASEEELVDLAAVLGFHSMLTQTQYYAGLSENEAEVQEGGFHGAAQAQKLRLIPDEAPNMTDVEDSIKKLKANDASLKTLNLNNMKNISIERLVEVCEAFKENTVCVKLEMCSVAANDKVATALADALKENTVLKSVNVESNFISGDGIVGLLTGAGEKQTLLELRVANQKPEVLGNKIEMKIIELIQQNNTLLRFGIHFECAHSRIKVGEKLKSNLDGLRKKRVDGN